MPDPMTLGVAATALNVLNGTISALKEAREAAKRSDDHDLKDKLSEVFDSVLELKEAIGNLRDENAELRKRLDVRAALKYDQATQLYYADNDPSPFCPACYNNSERQIRLYHRDLGDGRWDYVCKVCQNFYDVRGRF